MQIPLKSFSRCHRFGVAGQHSSAVLLPHAQQSFATLRPQPGSNCRHLDWLNTCTSIGQHAAAINPSTTCRQKRTAPCMAAAAAASQGSGFYSDTPEGATLRAWIEENGGYVHESLAVVENAPCGTRGVVAAAPIGPDVLQEQPLVVVPERLYMTSEYARASLAPLLEGRGRPSLDSADGPLQLALLLAVERGKGSDSFWAPYIHALPPKAPNAWQMDEPTLKAAIASYGTLAADWPRGVADAKTAVDLQCAALAAAYSDILGVSQADITWALGQVMSRAFGSGQDLGLAPFIDLMNHSQHAAKPDGFVPDDDDGVYVYVTSTHQDQAAPLAEGDELCISYVAKCSPLTAFLSFGFVPPELM